MLCCYLFWYTSLADATVTLRALPVIRRPFENESNKMLGVLRKRRRLSHALGSFHQGRLPTIDYRCKDMTGAGRVDCSPLMTYIKKVFSIAVYFAGETLPAIDFCSSV